MQTFAGLPPVWMNPVSPSYFAALGLPVVRGRTFLETESNAVIVSETAARAMWPNQDPIGKTWNVENATRTVVGIVKESGASAIVDPLAVEAYIPDTDIWIERAALLVHTKGDPAAVASAIVAIGSTNREPLSVELMRAAREQALDSRSRLLIIIGSLSLIATALAAAGMFALVTFAVAQRTREIGIRMAIGASRSAILSALYSQNAMPVLWGVVSGGLAGVALGKIARGLVFLPADPLDPRGFMLGIASFLVIALLATASPAIRALRIDPAVTLRSD
jgi:ABC-type antimicrobial peptide transport system permease subunit